MRDGRELSKVYRVELLFKDERGNWTETEEWYGSPSGFNSWFDSIDELYHPALMSKRAVRVEMMEDYSEWVTVR